MNQSISCKFENMTLTSKIIPDLLDRLRPLVLQKISTLSAPQTSFGNFNTFQQNQQQQQQQQNQQQQEKQQELKKMKDLLEVIDLQLQVVFSYSSSHSID